MSEADRIELMRQAGPIAQHIQEIRTRLPEDWQCVTLILERQGAAPLAIQIPRIADAGFQEALWAAFQPVALEFVDEYHKALTAQLDVLSDQFYETLGT